MTARRMSARSGRRTAFQPWDDSSYLITLFFIFGGRVRDCSMCVNAALRTPGCDLLFVCVVNCVLCALIFVLCTVCCMHVCGSTGARLLPNYAVHCFAERKRKMVNKREQAGQRYEDR